MPAVRGRNAQKKKGAKKRTGKKQSEPGVFSWMYLQIKQFTLAGAAGSFVIVAIVVAFLWAGGYVGLLLEQSNKAVGNTLAAAGLEVRTVTVKGRRQTDAKSLTGALGPAIGKSILHFDLEQARQRIEALGWVRSAAVVRLWPNTISISIRERNPAAVWQLSGQLFLIDPGGAVIREVGAYEYSSLPLIVGAGAPGAAADILTALASEPELEAMTSALVRVGERRWNMRLQNNTDVKLPETGIADALKALSIMHQAQGTLDREFEYIDLRDPERVIIRPRKGSEDAAVNQN